VAGLSGAALAALFLLSAAASPAPLPRCDAAPGWVLDGPARTFGPDNLYDYVDGAAEEYLLYGFARLDGITCRTGEDSIVIDVSRMADPELAYGMLCAHRQAQAPLQPLGMGGQITPGRAVFAKGPYYVEITSESATDQTPALRAYADAALKLIQGRDTPPEALAWFPHEGLVADSARLVPESVLGLRLLPKGYVATYEYGEAFVVGTVSPQEAEGLLTQLRTRFGATEPVTLAQGGFKAHDAYLGDLIVFRKGLHVAGLAKLRPGDEASAAAGRLADALP
jgi:hypothetical protein